MKISLNNSLGRLAAARRNRGGATAVELAITLMVFLVLVFGVMELSIRVFQMHLVNHLARQAARQVIVHGEYAPATPSFYNGPWGPKKHGPTLLTTGGHISDAIRKDVVALDPSRTTLTIDWMDGDNRVGSRVRVRLATEVDPPIGMFTSQATLVGESVMQIAH